ncbi:MAG: hypothetical protein A2486_04700 [Burkholderiales bacterium RIFOXYC12_FULL_65_23]|nr:MAG: hypothetical protein A2486_04700 [Burkholderiales bacterium RIFOXYC12_FULL_65_23]
MVWQQSSDFQQVIESLERRAVTHLLLSRKKTRWKIDARYDAIDAEYPHQAFAWRADGVELRQASQPRIEQFVRE